MPSLAALCPVHVGRDREAGILAGCCEVLATTGTGSLVLLAGEAGLGKSRLATEAMRLAGDHDLGRLTGQCQPESTVPYAPFVTAVRRRTRTMAEDDLRALFGGPALLAAALLPELAEVVPLPPGPPAAEYLAAAVWQLLRRLAQPAGAVLLLEDLHWADPDSLRLLGYLAREIADLPVLVLGTYRPDELHRRHPLTQALAELSRERLHTEVRLRALEREQVRTMVSAIFDGTEVGDEFVDAVLDRTAGNPFFVEELAKVLVERGDVYLEAGGDWGRRDLAEIEMPLTVRETLLARTAELDAEAVRVLQLAALAGDELDTAVLTAASDVDASRVDQVIRDAIRLQLLTEKRDAAGSSYAFRHALTREAFADEVVGPDRRRAHQRLAEALVTVHQADLDRVAARVADHFTEAGDTASALEFSLRAARVAAAAFATQESDRRYDQVLRLLPAGDDRRLSLLLEAAGPAVEPRSTPFGLSCATEARQLAHAAGDPTAEAHAAMVLQRGRWDAGDTQGAVELLEQVLPLVAGVDDYWEAWALCRLSRLLLFLNRPAEGEPLLERGIEVAQRSGNHAALSLLHGTRMMTTFVGPEFDAEYAAASEAARAADNPLIEHNLACNAAFITMWCGDFARAESAFRRSLDLVTQFAPNDRYPDAGYSWLLSLTGRYDEVDRTARPLMSSAHIPTRIVALTALCEVAERRGDADVGQLVAELLAAAQKTGESQRSVPALAAQARRALRTDELADAVPLFWQTLAATTNTVAKGSHWAFSPDLAAALAAAGHESELARWAEAIGTLSGNDPTPHNQTADTLCQAFLAAAREDADAARTLFAEAADRYRAMPCPAREVEALLGLADVDWRAGDLEASAAAAAAALASAEKIGATALVEPARQAVERAQTVPVLATVLFTDLCGSTEKAAALGDRAWQEVLARHHEVVRRELARQRGREIDTAGDGFLAAFDSPAAAIRSACAIRSALAATGLHVRAGLHTGECQQVGDKLTGIAVHIAARVNATAAPDEVLVSGTVRDLVAGSGLQFADRGVHELKGVPGSWPLYAVVA